jgi:parallel beta-helix repeat protein
MNAKNSFQISLKSSIRLVLVAALLTLMAGTDATAARPAALRASIENTHDAQAAPIDIAPTMPTGDVCGPVASDTTWITASSPYTVTCDIQVMSGVTLTIQSGVTVKFDAGTSLRVDGTLVARGATFISSNATPAKGNWGHIWFTVTSVDAAYDANGNYVSGSVLQDCLVEWGGGGASVNGAIETASASPFIDRNTIRNNGGSGIYAVARSASQPVVISRNSVTGNSPTGDGGGIYVSTGRIISNTIQGNSSSPGKGGGIHASASTLSNNTITGNNAYGGAGGGIYATGSTLTDNTVSGNSANGPGGGIYASGGTLSGNTVSGNTTSYGGGGGIYALGGTLTGNIVSGNTSIGYGAFGGGIYASLSTLTGNTVNNNTARNDYGEAKGGGIYAAGSTITGNTITGNTASAPGVGDIARGGGIYADGGTVNNNTISDSTASGGSDSQGGGVCGQTSTVQQNVITGNSANRGGALYIYKGTATANTILTNTTTMTGTLYADEGTATQNILQGNTAINGGGLYGYKANLTSNTVQNNTANFGGGIYADQSTVRGNTVTNNTAQSDGGGLYADQGTVTQNTISQNTAPVSGRGSGVYVSGAADVSYNNIVTNTAPGGTVGGVSVNGQPQIHYNNLYGNSPFDAEVVSTSTVSGTLNYWGPSTCTAIASQIYDGNDMPGRGQLLYAPSLYSPLPVAQLSMPTNLTIITSTSVVTLTWMPIPAIPNVGCRNPGASGSDMGYRIYYAVGRSCPPFDGSGLPQGNSPIDVGDVTTFALSGLASGEYAFVVATYDYLGRESGYSNVVIRSAASHVLTVSKAGTGSGTVTSTPGNIACGAICTDTFASGTVVTLTAAPGTLASFGGWSGACTDAGTCRVTMDSDKSVTATFNTYRIYLPLVLR